MISKPAKQFYNSDFTITKEYRDSLPDLQNGSASRIEGANVPIQQVGISNFRLPLRYPSLNGELLTLETSVDGYVGLAADKKGINMSRIIRIFYTFRDEVFYPDKLQEILSLYKEKIDSSSACLRLSFHYPRLQESLRSGLEGYQYYDISYEAVLDEQNRFTKYIHLNFEYSSACPCSFELAEHARERRNIAAIPHSQRSVATVTAELKGDISVEELIDACSIALETETQVMVKREDEQAFAEKNAAYQKFVEDAARLLYEELEKEPRIRDFVANCVHQESLHSHDAVSRICKGVPGGLR